MKIDIYNHVLPKAYLDLVKQHSKELGMVKRMSSIRMLWDIEHRVQMLLGIFPAKEVLPVEFKPAHSVGDLLTQHLDDLEQEAERKGGVLQALSYHFGRIYKASIPAHALHAA